jgi:hydrogenase nickel incorporation protein HypA/HybF
MHEYSIVQALVERVDAEARKHAASRVHAVRVRIGELAGVEIELLKTAYETVRHRTVCHDAPLEVVAVAARWACPQCGTTIAVGAPLSCATCGVAARLLSGDEIVLDRIEMEAA